MRARTEGVVVARADGVDGAVGAADGGVEVEGQRFDGLEAEAEQAVVERVGLFRAERGAAAGDLLGLEGADAPGRVVIAAVKAQPAGGA